jgi:hypothetical protein
MCRNANFDIFSKNKERYPSGSRGHIANVLVGSNLAGVRIPPSPNFTALLFFIASSMEDKGNFTNEVNALVGKLSQMSLPELVQYFDEIDLILFWQMLVTAISRIDPSERIDLANQLISAFEGRSEFTLLASAIPDLPSKQFEDVQTAIDEVIKQRESVARSLGFSDYSQQYMACLQTAQILEKLADLGSSGLFKFAEILLTDLPEVFVDLYDALMQMFDESPTIDRLEMFDQFERLFRKGQAQLDIMGGLNHNLRSLSKSELMDLRSKAVSAQDEL